MSYKFDSFIKLNNKSLINVYFFSVEDFLTKIWKDTKNNSLLLKSFQESILWEEIVKKYNNKSPLINTIKTAEYARKVYHCSKLDEIKIEKYDSFFHSCIGKFEIKCQTNNWTSLPQIVEKIPTLLKIKNLFLGRLFLVDFPYFPLKVQNLFQHINEKNCCIEKIELAPSNFINNQNTKQVKIKFTDKEDELFNMALWCNEILDKNPKAKIGCFISNHKYSAIKKIFSKTNKSNFKIFLTRNFSDVPFVLRMIELLLKTECKDKKNINGWYIYFSEQSKLWIKNLNFDEYENEQINIFDQFLTKFKGLNDLIPSVLDLSETIDLLKRLASSSFSSFKSIPCNIEILDIELANSFDFNHLWINLNHTNLKINHSILDKFTKSHIDIVYSFLENEDKILDENLLKDILEIPPFASYLSFNSYEITSQRRNFISHLDTKAPVVSSDEKLQGGSKIFQLQAACPFQAFAKCRLHIPQKTDENYIFDAKTRGLLVHNILEDIWKTLRNHKKLCSYSNSMLKNLIKEIVLKHLKKLSDNPHIIKLELKRLENLIFEYLEFEKERPPFSVVNTEKWQKIQIGTNHTYICTDRIDKLDENDALIIIDYKTGNISTKGWFTSRPDDPQLPIYCVNNKNISGLLFFQIKPNNIKAKGFEPNLDEEHLKNWDNMTDNWKKIFDKLAWDFYLGKADIDPKYGEKTCKYCGLQRLCRISAKDKEL